MGAALVIIAILELICAGACVLIFMFVIHLIEAIDSIEIHMDETNRDLEDIRFNLGMDEFYLKRARKEYKTMKEKGETNGVQRKDRPV